MDSYNEKILGLLEVQKDNFANSTKGKEIYNWCFQNFYPINSIYFDSYSLLQFYNQNSGRNVLIKTDGTPYPDYKELLKYWVDERIKRMENIIEANRIADNWEILKKQIQEENSNWLSNAIGSIMPDIKTYLIIGLGIAGFYFFSTKKRNN